MLGIRKRRRRDDMDAVVGDLRAELRRARARIAALERELDDERNDRRAAQVDAARSRLDARRARR